jgi:outer membrane protein assembly factor BamD (BamD/ComL family)
VPLTGSVADAVEPESRPFKPRPRASSLQEEAQLLARAHRAINGGNPRAGIAVLLEHQQRFPAGTLRLERQSALAIARCQSGELQRGQAEARRFKKQHPSSPMLQRLETACKLAAR